MYKNAAVFILMGIACVGFFCTGYQAHRVQNSLVDSPIAVAPVNSPVAALDGENLATIPEEASGLLQATQIEPTDSGTVDTSDTDAGDDSDNLPDSLVPTTPVTTVIPAGCIIATSTGPITITTSDNAVSAASPDRGYACIKAKIESARPGQTVTFGPGNYYFTPNPTYLKGSGAAILVPNGVTVQGSGRGTTVFKLINPNYPLLFRVSPLRPGVVFDTTSLATTVQKGSPSIVLASDQGQSVYLEIIEPNNDVFIHSLGLGLENRQPTTSWISTIRQFHGRFTRQSVMPSGATTYTLDTISPEAIGLVTASNTIPHTFDAGTPVRVVRPVTNVTLKDFSIVGNFTGYPNAAINNNDFSNVSSSTLVEANSFAAILVEYANESVSLQRIGVVYPWSRGIELKRSVGTKARDIIIVGSHNKGPGGQGYGFTLSGSTNIDAAGLSIRDTRHAVLFNANDSEHFNYISVTKTNRDINFHGLLDTGNVVSVGTMDQDYSASANATWAAAHFDRALMHVPTSRAENKVYFSNLNASRVSFNGDPLRQNDLLYAAPGGGIIYGQLGNDMIFGSDRADTLSGGVGQDTMTGGPGADTFVYNHLSDSVAPNPDIITDFSAINDKLDISSSGYTAANLQSSFDGVYTTLFTKNRKNSFELKLKSSAAIDLSMIKFVSATSTVATTPSLYGFVAYVRDSLAAAVYGYLHDSTDRTTAHTW